MKKECNIDLKQCETYCNEQQIYPAMEQLINELGLSQRAAAKEVSTLTKGKVSQNRARQVYRIRKPVKPKGGSNDPPKSETATKTEEKQQVNTESDSVATQPEVVVEEGAAAEQWEAVSGRLKETLRWLSNDCMELPIDKKTFSRTLGLIKEIEKIFREVAIKDAPKSKKGKS